MTVRWTVRAAPGCPKADESIPVHQIQVPARRGFGFGKGQSFAGMAELADAYGSGPYGGNSMEVQVLLPAPNKKHPSGAFCLVRETCVNLHRERSRSQYAGARKYANGQQAACVIGEFKSSCPHPSGAFCLVRETCENLHRERLRSQYAGARKYANGQQAACVIGEFKSSCPHQTKSTHRVLFVWSEKPA